MKSVVIVAALLFAGVCQAQVKMSVSVNGQSVGTAVLQQKLNASGGLEQDMRMTLQLPNANATFSYHSVVDKAGRPIREINGQSTGPQSKTTTVEFGSKSLKVTKIENGKSATSTVPIPKGNLADASTFWFVNVKPKVGAKETHMSYSTDTGQWKTETAKYVGDDAVPGTQKKAHHIHHDDGDMWLDDKGMPIRIEMNQGGIQLIFVRQ